MITLTALFVFGIGAMIFSLGVWVIKLGFNIFGFALNAVAKVLGFLLMPFGILIALGCGAAFLIPFLVPVAIVLVILGLIFAPQA